MLALELSFPAGRFHATPWGRHVNEGAVEWPPSPWRILRALIATWHLKAKADVREEHLRALVTKLAEKLPGYHLPAASLGHTRHYMPYLEGKAAKTTKVFDTFVQMSGGAPIQVAWDVTLSTDEDVALRLLAERLGYFGRAESLVEARLLNGDTVFQPNVQPLRDDTPLPEENEIVRLLAARSNADYLAWRTGFLEKTKASAATKAKPKKKASAADLPADIFDALLADTGVLQAAGWTLPPGAAHVNYARSTHSFDIAPIPTRREPPHRPRVARYTVASAVLPRITQALSVAERVHQALCKYSDQAPVFTGKDAQGSVLKGHNHAHIWCESAGERDRITHITVFARDGFDDKACRALRRLRSVWGHGGHDLQLILLGLGDGSAFAASPIFSTSTVWQSFTPFVATRHAKTHRDGRPKLDAEGWQIGSPEHDLRRLLAEAGLPMPVKLDAMKTASVAGRSLRWIQFQTERHHGNGRRAADFGTGFRMTFAKPVSGPLALGYGAHFGLGLFVPAD